MQVDLKKFVFTVKKKIKGFLVKIISIWDENYKMVNLLFEEEFLDNILAGHMVRETIWREKHRKDCQNC